MIPEIRTLFNNNYKDEAYQQLVSATTETFGEPCGFRISETPVFISKAFKEKVFSVCDSIIGQLDAIDFDQVRKRFVPEHLQSPSPLTKPHFLTIDFGVCENKNGQIEPQLIELQAFPTLFFYQPYLGQAYLKHYDNLPKSGFNYFFNGIDDEKYLQLLKTLIIGDENVENVILLEIYPNRQKTRIDFWATEKALGIEVVCMTQVIKEGKKLYYIKDGDKIEIKRIYNRVIADDLEQMTDLKTSFNLFDDLDVTWITHPDWFYLISKCILPQLEHRYIPKSYYLMELPNDLNLGNFVLKPLFSFAGKGIDLHPTYDKLRDIKKRENYILQEKVKYAPIIKTLENIYSKVELRMLYILDAATDKYVPLINLTRMSQGEMMNISYANQNSFIGSSISFFEE